jgi:hypothetical protein
MAFLHRPHACLDPPVGFPDGSPENWLGSGDRAVATLARLTESLMGFELVDHIHLDPFRLDGLALGGLVALAAQERLARSLQLAAPVVGGLLAFTFVWTRLVSHSGLELIPAVRAALVLMPLSCFSSERLSRSATSRLFRCRIMVLLAI